MKHYISLFIFIFISHLNFAQKNVLVNKNNQSTKVIKGNEAAKIIKNDNPIIIEQGKNLELDIKMEDEEVAIVRLHSSLGRLVRTFRDIKDKKFNLNTTKLLPGVYTLIIKQSNTREIMKLLITERG